MSRQLDAESLVARMIAELEANPEAQRLMLRALLTNEFLGMPARLDRIEKDVAELKADVKELKADVKELKTDVAGLKTDVKELKTDVAGLKTDMADVKTDVAGLKTETADLRTRMTNLENKMDAGFDDMRRTIDRLGARWGIRNESLFRQTMAAVLQESFGVAVEQRTIAGEQFDLLIFDGQHVLVEIAASVGPSIAQRLQRKQRLYQEETGVDPDRVILATASIHSRRAEDLRQMGIEVVEPEDAD